jgi:hypothetical protein
MSRIEKLTDGQIARFPEFVDRWTRIGLCTDPADRPRAETAIRDMYRQGGIEPPKKIVWCGSPLSQGLTRAMILDRKLTQLIADSLRVSMGDSIRDSATGCASLPRCRRCRRRWPGPSICRPRITRRRSRRKGSPDNPCGNFRWWREADDLGVCSKSSAFWGTPAVLRTSPQRQPMTRFCCGRGAASMEAIEGRPGELSETVESFRCQRSTDRPRRRVATVEPAPKRRR